MTGGAASHWAEPLDHFWHIYTRFAGQWWQVTQLRLSVHVCMCVCEWGAHPHAWNSAGNFSGWCLGLITRQANIQKEARPRFFFFKQFGDPFQLGGGGGFGSPPQGGWTAEGSSWELVVPNRCPRPQAGVYRIFFLIPSAEKKPQPLTLRSERSRRCAPPLIKVYLYRCRVGECIIFIFFYHNPEPWKFACSAWSTFFLHDESSGKMHNLSIFSHIFDLLVFSIFFSKSLHWEIALLQRFTRHPEIAQFEIEFFFLQLQHNEL